MAVPQISAEVCERLVNTALNHCTAVPAPGVATSISPPVAAPNFDALATSFGALSVAIGFGTALLGLLAIFAAMAWHHSIKNMAEREARETAEKCGREEAKKAAKEIIESYMNQWLVNEAPQIVRKHVENLQNASLGTEDDGMAAEEMGKEAG